MDFLMLLFIYVPTTIHYFFVILAAIFGYLYFSQNKNIISKQKVIVLITIASVLWISLDFYKGVVYYGLSVREYMEYNYLTPFSYISMGIAIIFGYLFFSKNRRFVIKNIVKAAIILLLLIYGIKDAYDFSLWGSIAAYIYFSEFFRLFIILALIFGGGYLFRRKNYLYIVTLLLWLLYGIYEIILMPTFICPEVCNIRVDLLLIYPILLTFTIIAIVRSVKNRLPNTSSAKNIVPRK